MPYPLSREEAIHRLNGMAGSHCFLCDLLEEGELVLTESEHHITRLSRYPRKWGHVMVSPKIHVETFSELPAEAWAVVQSEVRKVSLVLEEEFPGQRIFISSTGTRRKDIPMSCAHLHFNLMPVDDENEKPVEIFTWKHGLYDASTEEWEAFHAKMKTRLSVIELS